jgi:hypothetical protein
MNFQLQNLERQKEQSMVWTVILGSEKGYAALLVEKGQNGKR